MVQTGYRPIISNNLRMTAVADVAGLQAVIFRELFINLELKC